MQKREAPLWAMAACLRRD